MRLQTFSVTHVKRANTSVNQININLVNETACYGIVWKRTSKLNKRKIDNVRNKEKHKDKNKDKRLRFQ